MSTSSFMLSIPSRPVHQRALGSLISFPRQLFICSLLLCSLLLLPRPSGDSRWYLHCWCSYLDPLGLPYSQRHVALLFLLLCGECLLFIWSTIPWKGKTTCKAKKLRWSINYFTVLPHSREKNISPLHQERRSTSIMRGRGYSSSKDSSSSSSPWFSSSRR